MVSIKAYTYIFTLGLCLVLVPAHSTLGSACVSREDLDRVTSRIRDDFSEELAEVKHNLQAAVESIAKVSERNLDSVREELQEEREIKQTNAAEIARLQKVIARLERGRRQPGEDENEQGKEADTGAVGTANHVNETLQRRHGSIEDAHFLRSRRQVALVTKVAFSVALEDLGRGENLAYRQIIQFDKIVSNLGNAFNPNLGAFTAPTSGWYALSLTFMVKPHEVQELEVVNGGTRLFQAHSGGSDYTSVTKTVVVHLAQGSAVWVRTATQGFSPTVYGHGHTTFTGWLIFTD